MFYGCSSLKEIDLSNFNTNLAFIKNDVFKGCSAELKINIKLLSCLNLFSN